MKLIIAEKPSVAREIASTLGTVKRQEGYLEAGGYTITYAIGHLIGLANADAYNPDYKTWKVEHLPIVPAPFQLTILPSSKSQFQVVSKLLKQASEVIVATDAGREGQLIYEYIAAKANYRGTTKRLWLSSMTEQAIREAFEHLRNNVDYRNLKDAAMSRSEADWIVGINATRAMTLQGNTTLKIGRVQTPTLAMIVNRQIAIEEFKPKPYYEVAATFDTSKGSYIGKWVVNNQTRTDYKATAETVVKKITGKTGIVASVETKPKSEASPQLFDLTTLQRKANQMYGFTAEKTLQLTQDLYEKHKVLTYPRTDSRYISADIMPTMPARLQAAAHGIPEISSLVSSANPYPGKRVVDDTKISDHHAIIPTEKSPSNLRDDERKIYELVVRYTLAALLPVAKWENTTILTTVENETFRTTGRVLKHPGWRAAITAEKENERTDTEEDEEKEDQRLLPPIDQGMDALVKEAKTEDKQTKPPAQFTEASLLLAMERAGNQVDDDELAEAMKERGLGTPATRAAIIEKLKKDGYLVTKGRQLLCTEKARDLITAVPIPVLKSPELTGDWEAKLKRMERGAYTRNQFMTEITAFIGDVVSQIQSTTVQIRATESTEIGACPLCGSPVTQGPKSFSCSAWKSGCKFSIWKEISGHKMTPTQVRELLTIGITKKLKFKSTRTGKPFEAKLRLVSGKVEFVFEQSHRQAK